jgi:outer membrane protein TolC
MLLKNLKLKMMNWRNRFIIIGLLIGLSQWLTAQQPVDSVLKLSDAVAVAMNKNQDILIVKNNVRIAEVNKGVLNSGYLPSLIGSAGANYSKNNTDMTFTSGNNVSKSGAVSKVYNASLGLNYRLFDGLSRHYNFKILNESYTLSELQARSVIENTLIRLIRSYYQVALLTSRIENIKRTIAISNARLDYMKDKYDFGQATELDLLNAEVDRNNDSVNYINTFRQLELAENDMKVLMGVPMTTDFAVDTVVNFGPAFNYEDMWQNAVNKNVDYLIVRQSKDITEIQLKQSHTGYIPKIDINGKYSYNRIDNDLGSFLYQKSDGINLGASLTWNIFDGGQTRVREQNAKINLENAQIQIEKTGTELQRQVSDAYSNYKNMLFILKTEESNKKINELNFKRSVEQFKLGQITSLDFRKAQINLQESVDRYNQAMYNAKVAELELMKLAGLFLDKI